jgi:hypothetical protein
VKFTALAGERGVHRSAAREGPESRVDDLPLVEEEMTRGVQISQREPCGLTRRAVDLDQVPEPELVQSPSDHCFAPIRRLAPNADGDPGDARRR